MSLARIMTGVQPDYMNRIKLFCIGNGPGAENAVDEYLWKISFYELKPVHPDFIWLCAMPGGTVFRDMDEGGKMERAKFEETCQAIEDHPSLPVMRTYG